MAAAVSNKEDKLTPEEMQQLAEFCAEFTHNPVGFVWAAYPWGEGELKGKEPDKWQLDLLQDIADGLKTPDEVIQEAIASGHGIGKSALVSWIIQWSMATFEDCKGVVTANTQNQLLTKTWSELSKWHRLSMCRPMFSYTATAYYSTQKDHEKTWRIDAIPWSEHNSEAFAGLHNEGKRILVIFDEASAIADVIWEVVEGALTDANTEILWCAFGNPAKNSGRFYDCFNKFRAFWHTKQIDSRTVKVSNKKQIAKWIEQYGGIDNDIIRVRVLGQFPMQGDLQFISITDAEAAMERGKTCSADMYKDLPVIFGIDPAYTGDDLFVVNKRQGNYSCTLLVLPKTTADDYQYTAGRIAFLADAHNMTHGFIDEGYGVTVYAYLKDMGYGDKFSLVNFNCKPDDDYFQNKRAEIWWKMRQWLQEGGAVDNKPEMRTDLIAPQAFINKRGKFQMESKEDMKERGVASPNYADALALTFTRPIRLNQFNKFNRLRLSGRIRKAGGL